MTLLLKSQRLIAKPTVARGDVLDCCDYDGSLVKVSVTWPEPVGDGEQVVHGMAGVTPVTVRLLW